MIKTRLTLGLMFVAAFVAGISVGMFIEQKPPVEPGGGPMPGMGPGGQTPGGGGGPGGRGASWLTATLGLNPDQEQQVLKIWSGLERYSRQEEGEKRKVLQKERDEAIKALVPAEKQAELEKVHEKYNQQTTDLSDQRRKAFEEAVEKTKAILTKEQREKYEEILARRMGGPGGPGGPGGRRGGPGGPGGPGGFGGPGGPGPGSGPGPTTRPAE
jgi:Spy/CpxP family protein refolding chaperone